MLFLLHIQEFSCHPNLIWYLILPLLLLRLTTLPNVQLSPTKTEQALSHTTRPSTPIVEDWVSDSEDESETKALQFVPSLVQSSEQVKSSRHYVQPLETSFPAATPAPTSPKSTSSGKRRNRKACFICKSVDHLIKDCDYHTKKMAQLTLRNYAHRGNHKQYALLTHANLQKHMLSTEVLTQSKPIFNTAVRPVSTVMPKINVTRPRYAHQVVTKSKSPTRPHITYSQSPKTSNSPPRVTAVKTPMVSAAQGMQGKWGNPQHALKDKGVINSGCSRYMTGNMSYLSDFEELNEGYVAFGGNLKGGNISGKGKIKTGRLDFDDVYFVKELKFNLFSVSKMCDKKNRVLFTDTECLVLSPNFKFPDESQVLLRVPREKNMYNVNLKNIVPSGDLTCLFAKATLDKSNLWHRRLGHINFKTINKLVKGNLVRRLPIKVFENDNTCVACKKGKQHRASCKTKPQNGIAERKNRTLIEAAKTMLADSLLPIPFLVEAVNTACYVQNRVLVTKSHNKTPYELLHGRTPSIGFMRPFGCSVTILNTLDPLGKFKGKVDKGFLVRYCVNSKAFRVFNSRTHIIQETLHVNFLENKPNVASSGPTWLFVIDSLTKTMNYQPVHAGKQTNSSLDVVFDGEEHDFDAKKPESEVNVSPSSRYRDLNAEFEDCSDNSSNEVNAIGSIVPTVGPTYGKSSFIDASQLPDDPDMPELEDITYSNDEDVVGAEADLNNLESYIPEDPRGYIKLSKIQVGLKPCKKSFFNSRCRKTIKEEVYVCQPLGFKDLDHLDKVVKALYGLHQAPRASYEILATYLLENGFQRGTIDQTLFIKKQKGDILLQKKDEIFISQDKYVAEILRNFGLTEGKLASTHIDTEKSLLKNHDGEDVDVHTYRSMIGSLMYLTSSRPDIMFADNDVTRLQALFDKKKVVVKEATIREVLWLDDAEGVDCLPNKEIFAELARMGYENPSTKLTFYKAFFLSQVGKGFSGVETPLFKGVIVGQTINEGGDAEEHVKDVTAGDAAQGDDTAAHGEVPTVFQKPSIPSPTPPTLPPQPYSSTITSALDACVVLTRRVKHLKYDKVSQALEITKLKRRVKKLEKGNRAKVVEIDQVQGRQAESQAEIYKIDMDHALKALSMQEDEPADVYEAVDVVTTAKLITEVVTATSETVTAASIINSAAEPQVPAATITAAPVRVAAASTKSRKGVVIRDPKEESTTSSIIPADTKSKDKGKGIMVEEPKPLKKKQQVEMDEEYARKLHAELNKYIDWDVAIDHMKLKAKEDPAVQRYQAMKRKPRTEAQARRNMIMYIIMYLKNVAG
uniref:Ribonuclease H-like domain-containing protein n=1 Tax=Tanacetum cinerariifolium TaxID=118510 RepID=A0A6L2KAM0_TANCI|nr:ribonuclease H-like domain-containing protein [Tanacetum cinerariifolium]